MNATRDCLLPEAFRVGEVRRETGNTYTLELSDDRDAAREFAPGQFHMLYVFGVGEVPISISGTKEEGRVLLHTIRDVGPVTRALTSLEPGSFVGIRGPYGTFWPVEKAAEIGSNLVIISGGLGLAPLRPAIVYAMENRDKFGDIVILHGARSPEDIIFIDELHEWRGRFDVRVQVTVDVADKSWRGHVGVITDLVSRARIDPANTMALVCGPEIMMRYVVRGLREKDLPEDSIHVSMERNMKCGAGICGHCQYGPVLLCRDGPVVPYSRIRDYMDLKEL